MLFFIVLSLLTLQVSLVSIYDDSIPLPDLDAVIIKLMRNPQRDRGDDLFKHSYNYLNLLDDIKILLKKPARLHVALEKYQGVNDTGGPHFVNTTYDVDAFRTAFMWGMDDMNEFRAIINAVNTLWKELTESVSELKKKQENKKSAKKD